MYLTTYNNIFEQNHSFETRIIDVHYLSSAVLKTTFKNFHLRKLNIEVLKGNSASSLKGKFLRIILERKVLKNNSRFKAITKNLNEEAPLKTPVVWGNNKHSS